MNTEELDKKECTCNDHTEKNECHCKETKKEDKKKKGKTKELEAAKQTIMELQTKLMYAQADSINYRKRKDEETVNLLKYASQDLIMDMIGMVDNLDRAVNTKAESDEAKKIQTGISMINQQFKDILTKQGVVEIEADGYPFDANYMEAMMVGNDSTKPDEMVLEVLIKGYKYKDRVIKPAVVKVNQNETKIDNFEKNSNEEKGNE